MNIRSNWSHVQTGLSTIFGAWPKRSPRDQKSTIALLKSWKTREKRKRGSLANWNWSIELLTAMSTTTDNRL